MGSAVGVPWFGLAYVFERYNGWGYRNHDPKVNSPYLWSCSSVHSTGSSSRTTSSTPMR